MATKYVYFFGGGKADGKAEMKNLFGGKGANLAEMAGHKDLKLPVPPGFTITTEVCTYYYKNNARSSMPGMMETVLNVGLTEKTLKGLIRETQNERFAYDAYRRLIMMYSDVVMEKAAGIE